MSCFSPYLSTQTPFNYFIDGHNAIASSSGGSDAHEGEIREGDNASILASEASEAVVVNRPADESVSASSNGDNNNEGMDLILIR